MTQNKIQSIDISVVVQGSIDKTLTPKCLKSIRKHLPEATVILSTWKESNLAGLDYDILVENHDPGAEIYDEVYKTKNNVNRQILSTKNGLEKVQTKYVLKLRSDLPLKNTNFLNYFNKYPERNDECKILKERVLINSLYSKSFEKTKLLFHPSDWVYFGLREDVQNIWDIPLQKEPEGSKYFKSKERPKVDIIPTWLFQYVPEQYIWITFLKKNGMQFDFEHLTDINENSIRLSELSLVNNLLIIDYEDFGIEFLKYDPYKWVREYNFQITYYQWLCLYKKYCSPNLKISVKDKIHAAQLELSKKLRIIFKKLKKRFKY